MADLCVLVKKSGTACKFVARCGRAADDTVQRTTVTVDSLEKRKGCDWRDHGPKWPEDAAWFGGWRKNIRYSLNATR